MDILNKYCTQLFGYWLPPPSLVHRLHDLAGIYSAPGAHQTHRTAHWTRATATSGCQVAERGTGKVR